MSDPSLLSLETTLEQSFPGLTVLDHDLELSERYSADLVAMERSGRLVLVLLVEAGGDAPVLCALDALAFARHNAGVLGTHFGEPRLRSSEPPRVLLVAQTFPPGTAERLLPLTGSSVELYEVRQVRSARGENVYLTPVVAGQGGGGVAARALAAARSDEVFVSSLPPDLEGTARQCLARMSRIDEELALEAGPGRASFGFRGTEIARLEVLGGRLVGSVAPGFQGRALRSAAQVDFFVEEALGRYVSTLGMPAANPRTVAGPPAAVSAPRPEFGTPALPDDGSEDLPLELPGEHHGATGLNPQEPLLSPEELRAFQE